MEYELYTKKALMWGEKIKYILNVPISSPPPEGWPMLLFLHGYKSGTIEENKVWLRNNWLDNIRNIQVLRRCIVITPICPSNRWWITPSIVDLMGEVWNNEKIRTDRTRTYIMGYSMGAFCTWSMISNYPSMFAAAIPIAGGGKPNGRTAIVMCNACSCTFPLSLSLFATNACNGTTTGDFKFENLKQVSTFVWAFHSATDSVIPHTETIRNVEALPNNVSKITIFKDLTHEDTFHTVIFNVNIYRWIFSKKKKINNQNIIRT